MRELLLNQFQKHLVDTIESEDSLDKLLQDSILYSLHAKSKRLRPLIFLLTCFDIGSSTHNEPDSSFNTRVGLFDIAVAIELFHISSLIHDDLPALDNDDERWGKPTNHKVFGEGISLLAADSLISKSFTLLAQAADISATAKVKLITLFSKTFMDLCSGQALDIQHAKKTVQAEQSLLRNHELKHINRLKTGALFALSFSAPYIACMAECPTSTLDTINTLGLRFGELFQLIDDLDDNPEFSSLNARELEKSRIQNLIAEFEQLLKSTANLVGFSIDQLSLLMTDFFRSALD